MGEKKSEKQAFFDGIVEATKMVITIDDGDFPPEKTKKQHIQEALELLATVGSSILNDLAI